MEREIEYERTKALSEEQVPLDSIERAAAHAERLRIALRDTLAALANERAERGGDFGEAVIEALRTHGPAATRQALRSAETHTLTIQRSSAGVFLDLRMKLGGAP